ncbi:hypothetical protein BJY01DRAFT_256442 [Aspergillus pseudoustus]|uniref:Uncharacterized protein n=1 Tax=Aspergillus pseudoustus TaxID=1810923 RepID=A0ABR4IA63_9EURO
MEVLETAKLGFSGNQPVTLRIPNGPAISVSAADRSDIVGHVADTIVSLVSLEVTVRADDTLPSIIKTVCLVGGFSQLHCLR